jgi:hypothetical protein
MKFIVSIYNCEPFENFDNFHIIKEIVLGMDYINM